FQAEDGIRDATVTGVQTCALPICIADQRDHVAGLHALPHRDEQLGVVVIDRIDEQAVELAIVADGERVRALLRRTREHDDAVSRSEERRVGKGRTWQWRTTGCKMK